MKSMNKQVLIKEMIKEKTIKTLTRILIRQAEEGLKYSIPAFIAEPVFSIELLQNNK